MVQAITWLIEAKINLKTYIFSSMHLKIPLRNLTVLKLNILLTKPLEKA
jgi:hypothetical protein